MRSASRFAPPLLLMGLIFFLSAQPDLNSGLRAFRRQVALHDALGRIGGEGLRIARSEEDDRDHRRDNDDTVRHVSRCPGCADTPRRAAPSGR